jgi:hypothetical protein
MDRVSETISFKDNEQDCHETGKITANLSGSDRQKQQIVRI